MGTIYEMTEKIKRDRSEYIIYIKVLQCPTCGRSLKLDEAGVVDDDGNWHCPECHGISIIKVRLIPHDSEDDVE